MVFATASGTTIRQLAAGHGYERAFGAFDDLQIADDESIVEGHRTERLQALVLIAVFHELNTVFGDDHSCSPFFCGTLNGNSEPRKHAHRPAHPVLNSGRVQA